MVLIKSLLLTICSAFLVNCCWLHVEVSDLNNSLDQPPSKTISNLSLNKSHLSLITGESFLFTASGGFPEYIFSNMASDYLNETTHMYQAPLQIGPLEDQIKVTDSQGNLATSQIKIRGFETKSQFQFSTGNYQTRPRSIAQDSLGNIYVIGFERDSSNLSHWLVQKSSDQGISWNIVSDLVYRYGAMANTITIDASDNIYIVGVKYNKTGTHLLLQKSSDHGASWTQNEDFTPIWSSMYVNSIAVDSHKNLYIAGYIWLNTSGTYSQHWIIRKSIDDGATWSTISDYRYTGGGRASANSIAIDVSGNLYVTGWAEDVTNSGYFRWIVRKSLDSGLSWMTMDDFFIPSNSHVTIPNAITTSGTGIVYVAGLADNSYSNYWLVRKSTNGGSTWTTVLNTSSGTRSEILAMTSDSAGNIYLSGFETDPFLYEHGVVKKSLDGGSTWNTIQDFSTSGNHAETTAISMSPSGTIYTAGWSGTPGTEHWVVQKSINSGTSWTMVRDFAFVTGSNSFLSAMTVNPQGDDIYTVGTEVDSNKLSHWKIKKSTDSGSTFSTVSDFNYNVGENSNGISLTFDNNGNIYSIGTGRDSINGSFHWLTRKSTDNGNTWTTVDDYLYNIYADSQPSGIFVTEAGTIFVVGSGYDGSWYYHWIVRKSDNGGATWSTVRQFQFVSNADTQANAISGDKFGNIYVAGQAWDTSYTKSHWLIQKTTDLGVTWTTVHDFQYTSNGFSEPLALHVDPTGNILVSGSGTDINSVSHWLILKSSDFGLNWTVMSDFNYSNGQDSFARSISSDSNGNLYVGGEGVEANALRSHWLIRKSDDGGNTWVTIDDYVLNSGKGIKGSVSTISPCFHSQICAAGNIHDDLNSPSWLVRILSQ